MKFRYEITELGVKTLGLPQGSVLFTEQLLDNPYWGTITSDMLLEQMQFNLNRLIALCGKPSSNLRDAALMEIGQGLCEDLESLKTVHQGGAVESLQKLFKLCEGLLHQAKMRNYVTEDNQHVLVDNKAYLDLAKWVTKRQAIW